MSAAALARKKAELMAQFLKFDSSGDGYISADELLAILNRGKSKITLDQARGIYDQMLANGIDKDNDDKISIEELASWFAGTPSQREFVRARRLDPRPLIAIVCASREELSTFASRHRMNLKRR